MLRGGPTKDMEGGQIAAVCRGRGIDTAPEVHKKTLEVEGIHPPWKSKSV